MPSSFMQAGALIKLPIKGDARNVFTKMDDHGFLVSLQRIEGESVANFKVRTASAYTRPAHSAVRGLTDGIARELNLGHQELISVTSAGSLRLDVGPEFIRVSGAGTFGAQTVDIVDVDVDGFWVLPTVGKVVSGLNSISGVAATTTSAMQEVPAILLEEQSSYVTEYDEQVPPTTSFRLGYYKYGQEIAGTVISGTVHFTDDVSFATQVSGTPRAGGEWSLNQLTNSVRVFSLPPTPVNIIYTHSILESGMTMSLVGNGVKVMNLMLSGVQNMLFQNSGIGATAEDIIGELRTVDGAFWGE
jgi:hypothetical protein